MIVDCMADIDEIVRAVERIGGNIVWRSESGPKGVVEIPRVEVDDDEAAEELPASYFDVADELHDRADPGDVRDFVAACGRGDVMIAGALAPRLFASDANITAIERGLHERRCS